MSAGQPDEPLSAAERAAVEREGDDVVDSLATELRALGTEAEATTDRQLTARIMEQVSERQVGRFRRALDFLLAQRQLRFNVALAAPAAGIAALVLALVYVLAPGDAPGPRPAGSAVAVQDVASDPRVAVSFELAAPDARRVTVVGDFNDWNVTATDLRDGDGDGIWNVTVGLRPGRYAYKFLVDGELWVLDPDAQAVRPDGFGGENALLRL